LFAAAVIAVNENWWTSVADELNQMELLSSP